MFLSRVSKIPLPPVSSGRASLGPTSAGEGQHSRSAITSTVWHAAVCTISHLAFKNMQQLVVRWWLLAVLAAGCCLTLISPAAGQQECSAQFAPQDIADAAAADPAHHHLETASATFAPQDSIADAAAADAADPAHHHLETASATLAPKYCIADAEPAAHLEHVRQVLELLGYTRTDTPADANLIWAWGNPLEKPSQEEQDDETSKLPALRAHLRNLQEYQFLNHVPGEGFIATKSQLSDLSDELSILPRTFRLPFDYSEWQEFIKTERGSKMSWVRKDRGHRGISIIEDPSAPSLKRWGNDFLVQQLIRPYLIDNRLWDFGVHVAITSLEPLLAYVQTSGVLLRFCGSEYERNITPDTPTSAYVISGLGSTTPFLQVESLKPHFADAGNKTSLGSTMTLASIRSYLDSQGVDSRAWWLSVQSAIVQALQKTTPAMRHKQQVSYTPLRTNFFTLFRFDFMLDENLDTYLIEVNMSPGLIRSDVPLEEQLLIRSLVRDLLSLKGLAPGGHHHQFTPPGLLNLTFHPDAVSVGEPACAGGCATASECNSKEACMLCRSCRSAWQDGVLQRVMAEHHGSHGFMRVHPPHAALEQYMKQVGAERFPEVEDREDDRLVRAFLAAKCKHDFRWC